MKNIICFCILFILLLTPSCIVIEDTTTNNIEDSLNISTYVLIEGLENSGYWAYDDEPHLSDGRYVQGHWVSYDSTEISDIDSVFEMSELELNHPRIMAPLGFAGYNLNIRIESDDVINVSATIRGNDDIVLAYSPSSPDEVLIKDWSVSNDITVVGSFTFNVLPIGKIIPSATRNGKLVKNVTLTDREYYIDIKTYSLDGTPKVTAQLKLTVLKDDEYPWYEIYEEGGIYGRGEERSRFLQIELVKYSYSDTALHDEFERYDHLYN